MKAAIITVGNELLEGRTINTNAAFLGETFYQLGIPVEEILTVPDDEEKIARAIRYALRDYDILVITGGLGPTTDDKTREGVARALGVALHPDPDIEAHIRTYFASRGRTMPEVNRRQALVPEGFQAIPSEVGTAPVLWFDGPIEGQRRIIIALPGVPFELRKLVKEVVVPRLQRLEGRKHLAQRTIKTAGIGESRLISLLEDLERVADSNVRVAYLPDVREGVRVRVSAEGATPEEAEARVQQVVDYLYQRLERWIYGEGKETLEEVVGKLLKAKGWTIATAESCTGGLLCDRLTDVPGASAYVQGGIVAYANHIKIAVLGVDPRAIEEYGAVSEEVARQMASQVRDRFRADIGVGITGIAGPGGGTPEKPVGTVWIAVASAASEKVRHFQLTTQRRINKELAATLALNMVRRHLVESANMSAPSASATHT